MELSESANADILHVQKLLKNLKKTELKNYKNNKHEISDIHNHKLPKI